MEIPEGRNRMMESNIIKNFFILSSPMIIAMALHTSFNFVDMLFVGRLGKEAIAAVSMAFPVQLFMIAIGGGIGIGITSLISRNIGANNIEKAKIAAEQCLFLIVIFGIITTILGNIIAEDFFRIIGATRPVLKLVIDYIKPILTGSIFIYFSIMANSIFRGEGDTVTPMKVMISSVILNTILDPLLIFGIGPFPRMGVSGAAIATITARGIVCFIIIYFLRTKSSISIRLFSPKLDIKSIKEIFNVGIPSSLAQLINNSSMLILLSILSRFGDTAIAAYGIGMRLDSIAFLPGLGLSSGNLIMIGQNFGAKRFDRVRKISMVAMGITGGFMAIVGLFYLSFPDFFIRLFNSDPALVSYGTDYLKIVATSYFFIGVILVAISSFQGSGKGSPALVITILRLFILLIPFSLILSKYFAVNGVWWAIFISNILSSISGLLWLFLFFRTINKNTLTN
ncbi:hypothetical protein DRQ09_09055 [candidate division KSB1 bacterium]|nr:MAG: hypothetical protein DRQ09_09055 [candidate division KSB1 bacterium]